jgi:hypothetical protein
MTDVETTLRAGLAALAADTETRVSPPPVEEVIRRPVVVALSPRRRRRLLKVVGGVGAGVALTAGAAAATGTLPAPVDEMVAEFREWGFPAGGDATRMAVAEGEAGTYELWLSLLDDGGYCYYVRLVGSPLRGEDGAGSACSHEMSPEGPGGGALLGGWPATTGPGDDVVFGRVPAGSTAVDVVLGDGTSFRVEAQTDGWFVAVVPSSVADGSSIDLRRTG